MRLPKAVILSVAVATVATALLVIGVPAYKAWRYRALRDVVVLLADAVVRADTAGVRANATEAYVPVAFMLFERNPDLFRVALDAGKVREANGGRDTIVITLAVTHQSKEDWLAARVVKVHNVWKVDDLRLMSGF
jgi:hypothetical protein